MIPLKKYHDRAFEKKLMKSLKKVAKNCLPPKSERTYAMKFGEGLKCCSSLLVQKLPMGCKTILGIFLLCLTFYVQTLFEFLFPFKSKIY